MIIRLHLVFSSEIPRKQKGQAEIGLQSKGWRGGEIAEVAPWLEEVPAFCCHSIIQRDSEGLIPSSPCLTQKHPLRNYFNK